MPFRNKSFRFPPLAEGNGTLALRPLLISGMVEPVQDGDGGINIKVATGNPNGVLCVINPYQEPMKEGDKLEIFCNNEKVLERFVTADEVNQRVFFYLPTPAESGWLENCHYVLTRKDETEAEPPSAGLRIWVKLYKPGDFDRRPNDPDGHSELNIVQLPPELIEQGVIDAEWARDGVPVTIPHYVCCTRNDKIRLWVAEYSLPAHTVTQDQADDKQPIEIRIEQEHILGAGDGLKQAIRYYINDEVWNWADRHSKRTYIGVEAGGWRLEPPIFKEAFNNVITIRDLNKLPVTVQIHVTSKDYDLCDKVKMTFIGRPPGNAEPIVCSETREIDNVPTQLEIKVPYELIRPLVNGKADASYILYKKDGGDPLASKRIVASVVGDVDMLPEPTIRELIGDTLEPDEPYATVDVRYVMKNGDLICLRWKGTQSNGEAYLHEVPHIVSDNESKEGLVTFYINDEHISVLDNGTLDLSYIVANDAPGLLVTRESERLLAKVEKVRATLPKPVVEEAEPPGDVLDPSKVFDNVHVLIDQAKTVKGDNLTYYWRSPNPFSSTSDSIPITTVTEGKAVRFRVDAQFVTANIGQYVKVRYSVLRAATGRHEYSATLNLLIGELVGDLPPPEVIQAPDGTLDPMNGLNGVDVKASYLSMKPDQDIIRLKWLGSPGAGTSDDLELPGHSSGTVKFHLPATVVGANIDRRVTVEYDVTRYTITTGSQSLNLFVSGFSDPEHQLPRPQVPQASVNVLDLMTFSGDAKVLVEKWPYIASRQTLWLQLVGKTTTGATYTIRLLDGEVITPTQLSNGLNEALLRSELLKLGHSTPATVICKVAFDGDMAEDRAYVFPQLSLTIRTRYDYIQPTISKVADSRREIEEGGKTRDNEVTITGTATRGETVELFDRGTTSMGTASVGTDSTWNRKIGILTEKTYSITAKALYDADPVSSTPRTFTVKFAETPEIIAITDSRGPVGPGATTYDNSVLVEGSATPSLQVKLLGADAAAITLNVDDKGAWSHRLDNLKVKTYSLSAEALYDIDPPVGRPRTFVVAQAVTPTISRVSDIRGDIDMNGTTYYRAVKLTGKASPNEKITLLDNTAPVDTVGVNASGEWEYDFKNLTLKAYRLTARAEYGANPVSAPPRVFTVADFISPTIASVTDSIGPVAPDGTTYDTTVTLSGNATPREQIQLYNKGAPVGSPVNVQEDKTWKTPISGLTVSSHSVIARALYAVIPVDSPARTFTVAAHVIPTLTSVHDGISEVPQNGQTKSTSVTLRGTVTPNRQVQIYDNNSPRHTVTAGGDTIWSTTLQVGLGGHSVKARAISTQQETGVRSFTVISPIPPLTINQGLMTLHAWHFRDNNTPSSPPAGAYGDRTAQGGVPPYRYQSSNSNVAEVNATTGRVISAGNSNGGYINITATDAANQSASYSVSTADVHKLFGTGYFDTYTQCASAAARMGGSIPSVAQWRAYINNYQGIRTIERWCWASDSGGIGKRMVIYPATGQTDTRLDIGIGGGTADGFGIRRG